MSFESELIKFKNNARKDVSTSFKKQVDLIRRELASSTPKDTGKAAASWSMRTTEDDSKAVIENSTPYIERLNEGHSKQAPAQFIERVALQHGRPIGKITRAK